MEGEGDKATAAGVPPATKRRSVEERDAPPSPSRDGRVAEGAASRAADWFAALNLREYFGGEIGADSKAMAVFDKIRDSLVDLDRSASHHLDTTRRVTT